MLQEVCLALVAILVTYVLYIFLTRPRGMPPCPNPLPIIGNLIDVIRWTRGDEMQRELTKIAKQYQGKVFSLKTPGVNTVVVNSASTAREVLVTRKDEFAGRPYLFVHEYLHRGQKDIVFQDFNPCLVLQRKILFSAIRMFQPNLEAKVDREVQELIKRLVAHQGNAFDPLRDITLTTMNVICAMIYGERYEINDPEFEAIFDYNRKMFPLAGPLNILNVIPFLIHFPISDSRMLKYVRETRDRIFNKKYHEHQQTYKDGIIRDLTDALIKALQQAEEEDSKVRDMFTEDNVVMTMSDAFSAGFETTATSLHWFLLFMVWNPKVQEKLQSELDNVVGKDEVPVWKDRTRLPYTVATIEETMRCASVAPLLNVHKATKDSTLEGYNIPKGTSIIINAWAIHFNEKEWKNPHVFDPERFLNSNGELLKSTEVKSFFPFGAGRRVCPGEVLAKQELFIMITHLLHQFKVEAEVPGSPPPLEGVFKAVHSPKPYKVCFKERSK